MKIAVRHRHIFNRPKGTPGGGERQHFHKAYFGKPVTTKPILPPHLHEVDDDADKAAADLWKRYGKRYWSGGPPSPHPDHDPEAWADNFKKTNEWYRSPKNKTYLVDAHNAGFANESMLHNRQFIDDAPRNSEFWSKPWAVEHRRDFMRYRSVRNQHLNKEVNDKFRDKKYHYEVGHERAAPAQAKPSSDKHEQTVSQKPKDGLSNAKIGLGLAGAAAIAYGAHRLNKHIKKSRELEKSRLESEPENKENTR